MYHKLKELRVNSNMSQQQLADRMGVSRSCISSWECGQRKPNTIQIMKYFKIFKLKNNYFDPAHDSFSFEVGKCFDISMLNHEGVKKLYSYFQELIKDKKYLKKY